MQKKIFPDQRASAGNGRNNLSLFFSHEENDPHLIGMPYERSHETVRAFQP